MKMKAPLIWAALSALALPAFAQDLVPGRGASYTWAEASYGAQYAGSGDQGLHAPGAYRIASSIRVVPHIYVVGAYTAADFRYESTSAASVGVGMYKPLTHSLHGVLQLMYDRLDVEDNGPDFEMKGPAAEAGVRWRPGASQLDLTLKRAFLESDPYQTNERYTSLNVVAVLPISETLGLSFRFERASFGGDVLDGLETDTYLLGLRYGIDS